MRAEPDTFHPAAGAWGRAGSTTVRLRPARKGAVREALITAWRNRAPKRLAAQYPPDWVSKSDRGIR